MLRKFMQSLSSIIAKRELVNNINGDLEIISKSTLPAVIKANGFYSKTNFVSLEANDFDKLFQKELKGLVRGGNFLAIEQYVLEQIKTKLIICNDLLNKGESEDLLRDSLSVQNFNIVRIVELSRFALDFIRSSMIVIVSGAETAAIYMPEPTKKGDYVVSDYGDSTKDQVEWLDKNVYAFFEVAKILCMPSKDFVNTFNAMADVTLSPDTVESVVAINGPKRIDPFGMRNISTSILPSLLFGEFAASNITSRYFEAEAELKLVENTLLNLENKRDGKEENAKLEYQIQYYKGRLDKLRAETDKVKARYKIGS